MTKLTQTELKEFLEEKYDKYNRIDFIASDPISIPHQFTKKEDMEISGFLAATIAWGQRVTIIKNANKLLNLMDHDPHNFIMNVKEKEFKRFADFKHRTFNGVDTIFFIKSLQNIYKNHGGLQQSFNFYGKEDVLKNSITKFRELFFSISHPSRTGKHVSNPSENSASKRLCMYLRWMARKDKRGVDFGIWDMPTAHLMCPLDVHSGNVARKLGLLKRIQNDWKAVEELTSNLKKLDARDPVKYDFALFGLGIFEKF
jgi:uncharacterized protein (TIGR02757 family)